MEELKEAGNAIEFVDKVSLKLESIAGVIIMDYYLKPCWCALWTIRVNDLLVAFSASAFQQIVKSLFWNRDWNGDCGTKSEMAITKGKWWSKKGFWAAVCGWKRGPLNVVKLARSLRTKEFCKSKDLNWNDGKGLAFSQEQLNDNKIWHGKYERKLIFHFLPFCKNEDIYLVRASVRKLRQGYASLGLLRKIRIKDAGFEDGKRAESWIAELFVLLPKTFCHFLQRRLFEWNNDCRKCDCFLNGFTLLINSIDTVGLSGKVGVKLEEREWQDN